MEEEEKIKAYIIKEIVDENVMSKENLKGINDFLDRLTLDTLKNIAEEVVTNYV